jgi:hypothetical protein
MFCVCSSKGKPAHFKFQFSKKQIILGLLAVLGNVPDDRLPSELANGLPQLLSGLVRLLLDLKEQQDEAAKRADSEEEEDEGPVSEQILLWAPQGVRAGSVGCVTLVRLTCGYDSLLYTDPCGVQLCLFVALMAQSLLTWLQLALPMPPQRQCYRPHQPPLCCLLSMLAVW